MSAPAYQVLADRLRLDILTGRLRPGERLPTEPQLCEQSGLSRSTVREALRLLSSQHLIVTTRGVNGGSFVAEPSAHLVGDALADGVGLLLASGAVGADDFLEVRRVLEVPAAGLAAARRDEHHLAEIEQAMFDPLSDPVVRRIEAHAAFHLAIAAATGNPLLTLVVRPFYTVAYQPELEIVISPEVWVRIDHDHRQLLSAVRDGDVERAIAAAKHHIDTIRPVEYHPRPPTSDAPAAADRGSGVC